MYKYISFYITTLLFVCGSALADNKEKVELPHVKIQLLTEHTKDTNSPKLVVRFEIEKGWHIYGKSPGDIGLPTVVNWNVPEGLKVSDPTWPNPMKFERDGFTSFGYEDELMLVSELKGSLLNPKADHSLNKVDTTALIEWVLCKDECIPGKVTLSKSVEFQYPNDLGLQGANMSSFILSLCLAFFGGFLLNLMPCVFPVLSLKILSFVNQANGKNAFKHGIVFALGVLVSFWLLGSIMFIARAIGVEVGWGFQFQSPIFVTLMGFLLFIVGLNFLGVFEIGLSVQRLADSKDSRSGFVGSFFSGVLATLLATPCSAPFMASAIAAAFVLPVWMGFMLFTAIALGMSSPYVFFSAYPRALTILPKPGMWMIRLKQVMAFPMFATVIWLVWVLGFQVGNNGVISFLMGLLCLGFGLWVLGQWYHPSASRKHRVLAMSFCTILFVVAGLISLPQKTFAANSNSLKTIADDDKTSLYTEVRLQELLKENRPVLVEFSAAWCLTCQVNHLLLSQSEDVKSAFMQKGIVMLNADWTNRDPLITRAIRSHGREGVPLTVLYVPGQSVPKLLPQLLTKSDLFVALDEIPSGV